ncbi:2-C-methyl-D-erythritol 4-phosphate cytidylyltransferase [Planctobacterium marinum]|uniref:2-C-methyl-D-erythritol 4-phosphate cytidylyltransferase n=1 Tax=Planctobacterium marinum TaxID=1631968 RepID=A0AA48KRL6_9ALTE|nr:2-C-methyl-D-erythritol 4-phosphate cytidylyltransferase [Planctobacterium marinum]
MNNEQFTAVVPAAGVGSRMAADKPKQYLELAGYTVLESTLLRLISHNNINKIVLVISPEDDYLQELPISKASWLQVVMGGKERSDSVLNGLQACDDNWVLVHDAARPCVRHDDISALLALAGTGSGGILAKQATDTIKLAQKSNQNACKIVDRSISREHIWQALTPQLFPRKELIAALQWCVQKNIAVTDEASAIEQTGGTVQLVAGAHDNIKITHPGDLALAQFFLEQQQINNTGGICE